MVISAWAVLALLAAHFLGDFVCQSDWMAINKSKRFDVLALHVCIYSMCFLWCPHPPIFWLATFGSHFMTDAVTSRMTSRLWFFRQEPGDWTQTQGPVTITLINPWTPIDGKRHWFFVMIGLDQLIHFTTLGATWLWLSRF